MPEFRQTFHSGMLPCIKVYPACHVPPHLCKLHARQKDGYAVSTLMFLADQGLLFWPWPVMIMPAVLYKAQQQLVFAAPAGSDTGCRIADRTSHQCCCVQVGTLVIEAGFLFAQSFFVLMLLFALGELALFAGQAPCSKPAFLCVVSATILSIHANLDACPD